MNFSDLQRMAQGVTSGSVPTPPAAPSVPTPPNVPAPRASVVAPATAQAGSSAPGRAPGISVWFCGLAIAIIALVVVYLFFRIRKQDAQLQKLKQQARHTLDDKDVHDCLRHFLGDAANRETIGRAVVPAIPWQGILDQHTGRVLEALERAENGNNDDNDEDNDNDQSAASDEDVASDDEVQSVSQHTDQASPAERTSDANNSNSAIPADFTPLESPPQ